MRGFHEVAMANGGGVGGGVRRGKGVYGMGYGDGESGSVRFFHDLDIGYKGRGYNMVRGFQYVGFGIRGGGGCPTWVSFFSELGMSYRDI